MAFLSKQFFKPESEPMQFCATSVLSINFFMWPTEPMTALLRLSFADAGHDQVGDQVLGRPVCDTRDDGHHASEAAHAQVSHYYMITALLVMSYVLESTLFPDLRGGRI